MEKGGITLILALLPAIANSAGQPSPATTPASANPEELVVKGHQLLKAGQHKVAIASHLNPAIAHFEKQYAGESRRIYCADGIEMLVYLADSGKRKEEAIAVSPVWCQALLLKAYSLVELKQYEEARKPLERAITLAPRNAEYLSELGYIYQVQRNWTKALDAYAKAATVAQQWIDQFPDRAAQSPFPAQLARAWRGSGYTYIEQGNLKAATEMYKKCLEIDPNDPRALHELAYIRSLQ